MSRIRQLAVYAAEESALAGLGRVFSGPAQAQRYVDDLVAGSWWEEHCSRIDRVAVDRSRSRRWAGYALPGTAEIRLATWNEPVVLHELAHLVTPGAGHGAAFVDALCDLVRVQMGFHAYGALLGAVRNELSGDGA
ncbi:MAG: hypothetical protein ACRDY7_13710 [Acidimicrobiia bacterium]